MPHKSKIRSIKPNKAPKSKSFLRKPRKKRRRTAKDNVKSLKMPQLELMPLQSQVVKAKKEAT